MFEIKGFLAFAKSIKLNEGLGSNVWKFDPDRPGPGEGGKFSFKVKVQYTESDQGKEKIANLIADYLIDKLKTESDFLKMLADQRYVPAVIASRNTEGGFRTGNRGVLTGSIVFLDRKFYNDSTLATLPGFKPIGVGKEIIVNGKKLYDIEKIGSAKDDRSVGPNQPSTQNTAADASSTTTTTTAAPAPAGQTGGTASSAISQVKQLTDLFVGSKQADKNYKVETLQSLLNKVAANASKQIVVDGNYGTRTGGAIARAIGMADPTKPILAIDQATADKLADAFSKIAGIKVDDLIAAAKKEGIPAAAMKYKEKKKDSANAGQTPGGNLKKSSGQRKASAL